MDYTYREGQIIEAYKKAKEQKVKLEERKSILIEEMKKEFDVDNLEDLKSLLEQSENKIKRLEGKIEPLLEKLEKGLEI